MVGLIILGVVALLVLVLAVVAHRQDVRAKRAGRRGGGGDFERTQGEILGKAGNTGSGTGAGGAQFGGGVGL